MTTYRDPDRSISAWLVSEAPDRAPDDVLEASRERLRHTRQRRALVPAWRYSLMNSYAKPGIAAMLVLVVGFAGYQLIPRASGPGGPAESPSPSPAILAKGSFIVGDDNATEIDATLTGGNPFASPGDRTDVAGMMTVNGEGGITVDLECARLGDGGVLVIGGLVSRSAVTEFPKDSLFAIILRHGTPVRAGFMFGPTSDGPCMTFTLGGFDAEAIAGLKPIDGTISLRP